MNWRITILRAAALSALAAALTSCNGSGGGGSGVVESSEEAVFKLTYFRPLSDSKTKRLKPVYRAVMSESWHDRMGESPREPLAKAAPGEIYLGTISDAELGRYVKKLKDFGIDDLKASKPEDYAPELFAQKAVSPQESSYTRIFSVGIGKTTRSYYFRDQQLLNDPEIIKKFVKCESFISRACDYAVNVRTLSDPLPGREK